MIQQDKIKHFAAGAAVSVGALAVWALGASFGVVRFSDVVFVAPIAAAVAGATKEAADWMDNKIVPGMHGVEWADVIATAAGAVPVIAAVSLVQLLMH